MSFKQKLLAAFPLPSYVAMPAVGVDLSDLSVKFVELVPHHHGFRVGRYSVKQVPEGIIAGGVVVQREKLVAILASLREEFGLTFVRASLPEEPAYIFTTTVPAVSPDEVRSLLAFKLEEYVPLAPSEAVIDFDVIAGASSGGQQTVAVSVFPEKTAREYTDLFREAGLTPVSLEIEAQAVARAVIPRHEISGCMIVDAGSTRSGITVVGGGAVRFTTTVPVGGVALTNTIIKAFPNATPEEVLAIKNHEGLLHRTNADVRSAFDMFANDLKTQIERYYLYWQTRTDAKDAKLPEHPIKKIFLLGGYANIGGLPEFLERELRVPVTRANVWENAFAIDNYIPPISYEDSLSYAPAIGLALHRDT